MTPEQLKASILQRAMEGKLVPQDPNDEPASELLKRIKAEKEKLIKEGKIKRDKNETEIYRGDDGLHYEKFADGTVSRLELNFDIPATWEITRLRNIGSVISGGTPKSSEAKFYNGKITWITPADMGKQQNFIYFGDSNKHITEDGLNGSSAQLIPENSIVYSSRAPIGHINVVKKEFTTNQGCKSIFPILMNNIFVYWLLKNRTPDIQKRASGTTFKEISGVGFGETLICIPPLLEQERISEKIDELMNKVQNYELNYDQLETLNKNFSEKLRKSILQYAMQGKLVLQDPNDEPVEVLLEKIRTEKQKLFEEGKLKKKDLEESIIYKAEDNSYYWNTEKLDLNTVFPESWKLIYFKDFLTLVSGRDLKTSEFQEDLAGTVPYLTGATNFEAGKIITFRSTNYPSVLAYKNDLLITVKGTVGEMAYNPYDKAHIARQIMSISSFVDIDLEFIRYFLSSKIEVIKSKAQSMIPGISREVLLSLVIPLPPKNEQVRITQKLAILENKVNVLKLG
ncbi:hypothetical protein Si128_01812 [Streptococcus infantarius subsp. infantarius]|nr:hypothetical protein [Streptococcus infantarius subsp. infantarius]